MKDPMKKTYDQLLKMAKAADDDGRPATAVECLSAASTRGDGLPSSFRVRLADNLRMIGRFDEARKILQEIDEVPESKTWLVNVHRGQIEFDAGNFQVAGQHFEMALEQSRDSTIPYVYLAKVYAKMQQDRKAIEILTAGLKAEGDLDEVYLNLGYRYRASGKYQLAKEALTNALRITPDYPEAKAALRDIDSVLEMVEQAK